MYSLGYMADDPGRRRFFVYLDLFVASMAILVLAGNLAVLLIGWTGSAFPAFCSFRSGGTDQARWALA